MKLITRKNFLSIVCISFTFMVTGKLIFERLIGHTDRYYTENILLCLGFCIMIPAVLSVHYYLQRFPLLPVLIVQYLAVAAVTLGIVAAVNSATGTDTNAYLEMIISVTIPYVAGAVLYYAAFFRQVKKANAVLAELNAELS